MKISILSVGRPRNTHCASLAEGYLRWIQPFFPAELQWVPEGKDPSPARRVEREGQDILKRIRERDYAIVLDERGSQYDSPSFAQWFSGRLSGAEGRVVLVVGGGFGLDGSVRQRGDALLSLSCMTLPHELCLVVLLEQIYRACTLIRGIEYHH
ncbi:MAG TPA: toluene tolerance protein [Synergistaceae bacterium]|jgi:23S rRNA (pseudouridine1915-N3)-methyltransferase|nr:toluene tolerance protein [Synergistaceae bacterium]